MKVFVRTLFSAQSRKAWGGAVLALLLGIQTAMGEGGTFQDISTYEWITIGIGVLSALGLVYSLPNAKVQAEPVLSRSKTATYLELFAGKAPSNEPPATLDVTGTSTDVNP